MLQVLEALDPMQTQRKKEAERQQKAEMERQRREQAEADRQRQELERQHREQARPIGNEKSWHYFKRKEKPG